MEVGVGGMSLEYTTSEGVELTTTSGAPNLNDHIERSGLQNYQALVAKMPDGYETYVLFHEGHAVFESQSLEAVACHIEMVKMVGEANG